MANIVIVFGPTGSIASIAARTAHKEGAKVYLAMRDTSKAIPGLSPEQEKAGNYERVQADLTQPETITAAIQKSRAQHAFMYAAVGNQDHMKSTVEALKSAGVTFVVFLSSYTVKGPLQEIPPEEAVSYFHARIELSLQEVYGEGNYVAIRPGGFATNSLRWKASIKAGKLPIYGPSYEMDCITPGDMGRTSGNILVNGARDGEYIVYLCGPQLRAQKEMALTIAKVLGKELEVSPQTPEQATEMYMAMGIPEPLVRDLLKHLGDDGEHWLDSARFEEAVENVKKYTGQDAETFEHWLEENKELFG